MSVTVPILTNKVSKDIYIQGQTHENMDFVTAIRDALYQCLKRDPSVLVIGEGAPDPKGIFGSTKGLQQEFGVSRVLDMPLSENGVTGICIGAAITGMRPIMIHQRLDFALLAMDQIINNAAKWSYMFNGKMGVPLVLRLIVGRGWGQGPQHAQSLQAMFAHIPGLKVVMPAVPSDAKGMLCSAIMDNNPVIFIEHRWLHHISGQVPAEYYECNMDKAVIRKIGRHVTIAAFSYMVVEALQAANMLKKFDIDVEVIDMRSASPLDMSSVFCSLEKTGRLIVADTGHSILGLGSEIICQIVKKDMQLLKRSPSNLGLPHLPCPTTHSLANNYYPGVRNIVDEVFSQCDIDNVEIHNRIYEMIELEKDNQWGDVPNKKFTGPF